MGAPETTFASHPGNIQINFIRYIRYFPFSVRTPAAAFLIGLSFLLFGGIEMIWLTACAICIAILKVAPLYARLRRHYRLGCLNPAIVLQSKPLLLAVYTELSNSEDRFVPIVKILRHPRLASDDFQVGARCATVSLYFGSLEKGQWDDFDPKLVNAATADQKTICRSVDRLDEGDWFILEEFVRGLREDARPGLYPVKHIYK